MDFIFSWKQHICNYLFCSWEFVHIVVISQSIHHSLKFCWGLFHILFAILIQYVHVSFMKKEVFDKNAFCGESHQIKKFFIVLVYAELLSLLQLDLDMQLKTPHISHHCTWIGIDDRIWLSLNAVVKVSCKKILDVCILMHNRCAFVLQQGYTIKFKLKISMVCLILWK